MSLVTSSPTKQVAWNPAAYAANSTVQQGWARELIAKLKLRGDENILDLGCGDGKITAELARAVPRGSVTGVDASPQMVEFAKKVFPATEISNLRFRVMDARTLKFERRCDLIFSNAALHWVDDHEAIVRGSAAILKPGGRLMISCGGKGNAHDVFLAIRPVMRLKRWREFFRKMPLPYFFYAPGSYEKWLPRHGFKINRVQLTPKDVSYDGAEGFATWLRTTWLPFVQRVPESVVAQASSLCVSENHAANQKLTGKMPVPLTLREEFIAAVTQRYVAKHPPDTAGKIPVRMVRLEIDAVKI